MNGYFAKQENFDRLTAELERWRGTPFVPKSAQCGSGADCVSFVHQVLVNIGAIAPVKFPPYVVRGGGEAMREVFEAGLAKVSNLTRIWKRGEYSEGYGPPERGDVLLLSTGKAIHHLAILSEPPVVWHCMQRVREGNIHDNTKLIWATYRVQ